MSASSFVQQALRAWQLALPHLRLRAPQRTHRAGRRWAKGFLIGVLVGYALLSVRLYQLQVAQHERWKQRAAQQHMRKRVLPGERGRFLMQDAGREVVATVSLERGSLLVEGRARQPEDAAALVETLDSVLDFTPEERAKLEAFVAAEKSLYVRRRKLTPEHMRAIREAKLSHVSLSVEPIRVHPFGPLTAQVVGLTRLADDEARGREVLAGTIGLERTWNRELQGRDGFQRVRLDSRGRELAEPCADDLDPSAGADVALTIDRSIQAVAVRELARTAEEFKPQGAAVVVVDPATGDVLAIASWPTADPNDLGKDFQEGLRLRAITDTYEPGSTVKPLVVGTAWEQGLGGPGRAISCPQRWKLPGRRKPIVDVHRVGDVTELDVLIQSSNVGAVKIADRLGKDGLEQALRAFGIGAATGLGIAGESRGSTGNLSKLHSPTVLGSVGQGYAFSVTPLQMALAYGALANGGTVYRPRLVRALQAPDGTPLATFEPQVLSRPLSAAMVEGPLREALIAVVNSEHGTAKRAKSDVYTIAGKTGTTKLLVDGRYHEKEIVASFCGFAPAERPRLAFSAVVWGPTTSKGKVWGGTVAAPLASRVAVQALRILGVPESPKPAPETVAERR
ncbi:MAG: penicillin-binding protein 2 [Planctomycetes bacterium]|nr:penicillin-binding protein 2 [Planctomycetota bacterium]